MLEIYCYIGGDDTFVVRARYETLTAFLEFRTAREAADAAYDMGVEHGCALIEWSDDFRKAVSTTSACPGNVSVDSPASPS